MGEETSLDRELADRLSALSPQQRAVYEQAIRDRAAATAPKNVVSRRERRTTSSMDFSLFFFSGNGSSQSQGGYDLLLDCARYGDCHGYSAIWLPERHFVDFGGLYPNPAVLAAAIAGQTERIAIRAGSVALPLHHPVRVAEEWSVVDNLSGGRVAISCASGWHPDDFILAPGDGHARYHRRKDEMFELIEIVQRLWSGERVELPRADGTLQQVRTLPRPVQARLPLWVSSQGSTDTFVRAGQIGANLLTGLAGTTGTELGAKIAAYREAVRAYGHDPRTRTVTVMVHTFLGATDDAVKAVVREPLIEYLRTFLAQQDKLGNDVARLAPADREAMLAASFERYFESAALFGTPDKAESLIEDLVDLDVDEVACLIDFGLEPHVVRQGLSHLTELKSRYLPGERKAER